MSLIANFTAKIGQGGVITFLGDPEIALFWELVSYNPN